MTKVFQNLRKKLGGSQNLPKFAMEACMTNMLMWRLFMASIDESSHTSGPKTHRQFGSVQEFKFCLFNITKKLISENSETLNVNSIESTSLSWTRSTLLNDRALKWTKARAHVTRIQYYAWERFMILRKRLDNGKVKWPS